MAKKKSKEKKPSRKRFEDMSDEDREAWGKAFGKRMEKKGQCLEKNFDDFGDKMEKRFGKDSKWERRFEKKGCCGGACWGPFSFIAPIIESIVGIIILIIAIFLLNFINAGLGSTFISALTIFFSNNLHWFFIAGLFFNYGKFIVKRIRAARWFLSPLLGSAGFAFAIWILAGIFAAINVSAQSGFIARAVDFATANILNIFIALLVLSYAFAIVVIFVWKMNW